MDWITTETRNNIVDLIKRKKAFAKYAGLKKKEYQDVFNTFDKFEAINNEYWRTQEIATLGFIKDIDSANGQFDVFEIMDSYDINVTKFGEVGATLLNTTVIDVKESNKRNYKN